MKKLGTIALAVLLATSVAMAHNGGSHGGGSHGSRGGSGGGSGRSSGAPHGGFRSGSNGGSFDRGFSSSPPTARAFRSALPSLGENRFSSSGFVPPPNGGLHGSTPALHPTGVSAAPLPGLHPAGVSAAPLPALHAPTRVGIPSISSQLVQVHPGFNGFRPPFLIEGFHHGFYPGFYGYGFYPFGLGLGLGFYPFGYWGYGSYYDCNYNYYDDNGYPSDMNNNPPAPAYQAPVDQTTPQIDGRILNINDLQMDVQAPNGVYTFQLSPQTQVTQVLVPGDTVHVWFNPSQGNSYQALQIQRTDDGSTRGNPALP